MNLRSWTRAQYRTAVLQRATPPSLFLGSSIADEVTHDFADAIRDGDDIMPVGSPVLLLRHSCERIKNTHHKEKIEVYTHIENRKVYTWQTLYIYRKLSI